MAAGVPGLGAIDWKWFLAGIIFSMFILPMIMRLIGSKRSAKARPVL